MNVDDDDGRGAAATTVTMMTPAGGGDLVFISQLSSFPRAARSLIFMMHQVLTQFAFFFFGDAWRPGPFAA